MNELVSKNKSSQSSTSKESYFREDHIKYLDLELYAQNQKFLEIINKEAITLLNEGKLIPAKYIKIENGQLIVKISKSRTIPRKGEYLTAVLLEGAFPDYRNWGDLTWKDLRRGNQISFSEAICIWQSQAEDSKFIIAGFRGVSLEFATHLLNDCIIIFSPQEPPREYLISLQKVAAKNNHGSQFLDFNYDQRDWNPTVLSDLKCFTTFIKDQMKLSPFMVIQGPPGTGKTYKLAELISELIDLKQKVIVTALTNRALIELAKKEPLKRALQSGVVTKVNLRIDEKNEVPELLAERPNNCSGELVLSTFYIASKEASEGHIVKYDYVIMEEASQALLTMFEACIILGTKVIIIGDQNQLPPIVLTDEREISFYKFLPLIQGMRTICDSFTFPSVMLNKTFRLSNRGARFTSFFYKNEIVSASHQPLKYYYNNLPQEHHFLFNKDGGPFWLKIPLPTGIKAPEVLLQKVAKLVNTLHTADKTLNIAVVSKFIETVTKLQIEINALSGESEKILVDTVERVQGMTCDICFFIIPNTSLPMSLNQAFFNVATSRASRHTIIISDESILQSTACKGGTRKYLEALEDTKQLHE